jgi:hypothetical protein
MVGREYDPQANAAGKWCGVQQLVAVGAADAHILGRGAGGAATAIGQGQAFGQLLGIAPG